MTSSRLPLLVALVALILAWLGYDELRKRTVQNTNRLESLSFERQRLERIGKDVSLPERVKTELAQTEALRNRWFVGASPGAARSQMVVHLQGILSDFPTLIADLKFQKASDVAFVARTGTNATELANDLQFEPFSIIGRFSPQQFMVLLARVASSDRAITVDGVSVAGARFEIYGKAGLLITERTTVTPAPARRAP